MQHRSKTPQIMSTLKAPRPSKTRFSFEKGCIFEDLQPSAKSHKQKLQIWSNAPPFEPRRLLAGILSSKNSMKKCIKKRPSAKSIQHDPQIARWFFGLWGPLWVIFARSSQEPPRATKITRKHLPEVNPPRLEAAFGPTPAWWDTLAKLLQSYLKL